MSKPSILIIDDEPLVLDVLVRLLSARYQVTCARTIEQGLAALAAHADLDLILTDFLVGEKRSLEFLSQCRRERPHTKRVLMSGKLEPEVMANVINNDLAQRILLKPWNPSEVLEIIHQLLCSKPLPAGTDLSTEKKVLMSGRLSGICVTDLIYLLSSNQKNGILSLRSQRQIDVKLFLRGGRIVSALAANSEQKPSLSDIVDRTEGEFIFIESDQVDQGKGDFPAEDQIQVI